MNLTKALREKLAAQVVAKAIEVHAPSFNKQVEKLNIRFAAVHEATVKALLPDLPKARWNTLIQEDVMYGVSGLNGNVYKASRREDGSLAVSSGNMGEVRAGNISEDRLRYLLQEVTQGGKWASSLASLSAHHRYSDDLQTTYEPRYPEVLPKFSGSNDIKLSWLEPENADRLTPISRARLLGLLPLVGTAHSLSKLWHDLIIQALGYYEEVYDLLLTCKTRKQLQDVFPEAAAMLPPEPVKRHEILPAELAKNVRRRLMEGVPV